MKYPDLKTLKPYLRLAVLTGVLLFVGKTLGENWQKAIALDWGNLQWGYLVLALGVTLIAHCWTGWVWGWILADLGQPVSPWWSIRVYLQTNLAKYLPGNVWHFYGRVQALQGLGISLAMALLSVILEPLLMAAAALLIGLICYNPFASQWQILILIGALIAVHPYFLNPILQWFARRKQPSVTIVNQDLAVQLKRYPFVPFVGEIIFIILRGLGFLITLWALSPLTMEQIPLLFSSFSLAWLLGLIIPGAPGGIGVFEATAIPLLQREFPLGVILASLALYRLIGTTAEAIGAGLITVIKSKI